ncbi:hypothetical protein M9435_005060 [Picochlorum sp. BPE23]|nr:hypothetical protein M9435_005060 [Picochlorum sp. BPE23]
MFCSFKGERVFVTWLVLLVTTTPHNWAVCKSTDMDGSGSLLVQVTRNYVQADLEAGQTTLGLLLNGYHPQEDPVRVTVKWSKFGHKGPSNIETVEWDSGSLSATKNLTLRYNVSLLENPLEDFIRAEIVHASRGRIDESRGSTMVGLAKEEDLPEFAVASGEVIAAGESANLSVHLVSGRVFGDKPALIAYAFKALRDPNMEKYFPEIVPTNGILSFVPGETVKYIPLPVEWESVAPEARYHIAMGIYPVFKAKVSNRDPVVAVHLLGTARGACPPGSSLGKTNEEAKELVVKSLIRVHSEQDNSGENSNVAIALYDRDGSSIPLFKEESASSSRLGALVENRMDAVWVCIASGMKRQLQYRAYTSVQDMTSSTCPKSMAKFSRSQVAGYRVELPVGLSEFRIHSEDRLAISILRQGDVRHTLLRALKIHPSQGEPFLACDLKQDGGATKLLYHLKSQYRTTPECVPGEAMNVVLHHGAENVRIQPELLVPNVPSIRIEMNGQVVTQHHARTEDRISSHAYPEEDEQHTNSGSVSTEAYIMTLPAGYEIPVDVVVFGEDGTTSSKYTLVLKREPLSDSSLIPYSSSIPTHPNLSSIIAGVDGFAQCQGCAPGWYSFEVDAQTCKLCPPGTFAEENGFECVPCAKGTYSVSWGSNRCKHCIEGTVAATVRSTTCSLCPESVTTNGDGQSACDVARH